MTTGQVRKECLIHLDEAGKHFPGFQPTRRTLDGWVRDGLRRDGRIIKLESCRIGGRKFTSEEAIDRFLAAINEVAV